MSDTASRDLKIMQWQQAKDVLEAAKASELALRNEVVAMCFPNAKEGTNNIELGNGYKLKAVNKFNYNLPKEAEVDPVLERIEKIGEEGKFIAERLVKFTPELSISEYRALKERASKGEGVPSAILKEIETVLKVSPGTPSLELVVPKATPSR